MKTNQVLTRKMGDFEVKQRTKDSMFNATSLIKQWNEKQGSKKEVNDFVRLKQTCEFIETIENRENGGSPVLKTRGKNASTWMSPVLFIDFSMWINPSFKYDVIKFVYDELIQNRHGAGDSYLRFSGAMISLGMPAREVGETLNYIVFNEHEKMRRNRATESELKDLESLEKKYSMLVEDGYITNLDQAIKKLRQEWRNRHVDVPKALQS